MYSSELRLHHHISSLGAIILAHKHPNRKAFILGSLRHLFMSGLASVVAAAPTHLAMSHKSMLTSANLACAATPSTFAIRCIAR